MCRTTKKIKLFVHEQYQEIQGYLSFSKKAEEKEARKDTEIRIMQRLPLLRTETRMYSRKA